MNTTEAERGAARERAPEWLRYGEHDRKRRPSTIADHRNVVRHDLLPEFGEAPLKQVTTEWVDACRARLVAEGRLSDRTINRRLVLLHGIFKRAVRFMRFAPLTAAGGVIPGIAWITTGSLPSASSTPTSSRDPSRAEPISTFRIACQMSSSGTPCLLAGFPIRI